MLLQRCCGLCGCDLFAEIQEILSVCPSVTAGLGTALEHCDLPGSLKAFTFPSGVYFCQKKTFQSCLYNTLQKIHCTFVWFKVECFPKYSLDFFLTWPVVSRTLILCPIGIVFALYLLQFKQIFVILTHSFTFSSL